MAGQENISTAHFKIKKIDTEALKGMKGKKVHGVDNIDSYSIKIAGPLMEEALLQLVTNP